MSLSGSISGSRYNENFVLTKLKPKLIPPPLPRFSLGIITFTFLNFFSKYGLISLLSEFSTTMILIFFSKVLIKFSMI